MTTLTQIKKEIENLPPQQRAKLEAWLMERAAQRFDDAIESDAAAGKLDALANAARTRHKAGKSKPMPRTP
jgi:hypothetical protein